jgi:alcohol dehydrogenase/propanol-preferring alcohol dehydrogenase
MRAWAVVEPKQPLQELEWPTPEPTGSQVLLEVTHAGVCHSDLHIWEGEYDLGSRGKMKLSDRGVVLPLAMGHEIVGRVVKWGPEAEGQGLAVGQTRIVFPWVGCGTCARCRAEEDNMCLQGKALGVFQNGGYATHVLAPEPRHLVDPGNIDRRWPRPMRARASRSSRPSTRSCRWGRTSRSCWSAPAGSGCRRSRC